MSAAGGVEGFVTGLITNLVICTSCFLIFELRRNRNIPIYATRTITAVDVPSPRLDTRPFRWIPQVLKISEQEILTTLGLDAVCFLRFIRLGVVVFAVATVGILPILIPVNLTGDLNKSEFELLSMANLKQNSPRFWAHLVMAYIFSFFLYRILWSNYRELLELRKRYQSAKRPGAYTILVQSVPSQYQSNEGVADFFRQIYPKGFYRAVMVPKITYLELMVRARRSAGNKLEHAEAVYLETEKRPMHRNGFMGLFGEKVDSITFYSAQLYELHKKVRQLQSEVAELRTVQTPTAQEESDPLNFLPTSLADLEDKVKNIATGTLQLLPDPLKKNIDMSFSQSHAAFISFKSLTAMTTAHQIQQHGPPGRWKIRPAPAPRDVFWENLTLRPQERNFKRFIALNFHFWLICFWTIPVALITGLSSLSTLAKALPFLESFLEHESLLRSFLESFIPSLALTIVMAFLPKIVLWAHMYAGTEARSWLQMEVLRTLYIFNIVNVLVVSIVAGSFFHALDEIIESPASILSLLGESMPQVATFFVNYVMLQTLGVLPISLLRVYSWTKSKILMSKAATERERREAVRPESFKYGTYYPAMLLVFVIGLSFSTIAPVILPICLAFFVMANLIFRYQLLYVHIQKYQSGGKFWPIAFRRTIVGILVYQGTLMCIFFLKLAIVPFVFMIPLVLMTLWFGRYCEVNFATPFKYLPLETAVTIDREREDDPDQDWSFLDAVYHQPCTFEGPTYQPPLMEQNPNQRELGSYRNSVQTTGTRATVDIKDPKLLSRLEAGEASGDGSPVLASQETGPRPVSRPGSRPGSIALHRTDSDKERQPLSDSFRQEPKEDSDSDDHDGAAIV